MRRKAIFLLLPILLLTLSACKDSIDDFTGRLGERIIDMAEEYVDAKESDDTADGEPTDSSTASADPGLDTEGITVTEDSVILTLYYADILQTHTYFFVNTTLAYATVTMDCSQGGRLDDARSFFESANRETQQFINIYTKDDTVSADYTQEALSPYMSMTMDELATSLEERLNGGETDEDSADDFE